ncbi:GNAT family N-acetyltransferase [Streptomyces sp. NPDC127068]|uniref:GNAT family N-acetyltransferase n=1 Tax=Streptomyces sp. NPDC127068 TaxID=3347127 RepID=UPI00364FF83A
MGRMPISNTPKRATLDDARTVSRTLAGAFADDPMMRWFLPDETTREVGLGRYFTTIFTRHYARHGVCERTDAAAACWVAPEAQANALPDAETLQELVDVLGERGPLFREALQGAAEHAPTEPHWYLAVVGADPVARGQGHGSALLRSGLARADAAGLPVYLESSKESNIPVYEHFGFTVLAEAELPGGGPKLWPMRRAPRPAAGA